MTGGGSFGLAEKRELHSRGPGACTSFTLLPARSIHFIAVRDVRNHQKPGSSQAAPETLYKSAQFALGISGRCRELRERYDPPVPLVQRRE